MNNDEYYQGCVVGGSVGDIVGAPVEAKSGEVCQKYLEEHVRPMDFKDVGKMRGIRDGNDPYVFGQVTDDTQLSRELLRSIVTKGEFDPEDFAYRVAWLFEQDLMVGYGRTTKKAAVRLQEGVPWDKAGEGSPAAGNGSAMRAAPIGLLHFRPPQVFIPRLAIKSQYDRRELVADAINQGICTHRAPMCSLGSIAIAGATVLALEKRAPWKPWLTEMRKLLRLFPFETEEEKMDGGLFLRTLGKIWEMRGEPPETVLEFLLPKEEKGNPRWRGTISPYVLPSVMWALYSFLHTPKDYWETICTAIWPGGDVDTTAAMAGAISGAYNGLKAIPEEVAKQVHDRDLWGYQDLCNLGSLTREIWHHQKERGEK